MRTAIAILMLALAAACTGPSDINAADPSDPHWGYITGPNGEECLVHVRGAGQTQMMGLDCETVNTP